MKGLVNAAFGRARFVLLALLAILIIGVQSYRSIPKEASPEIAIPYIMVTVTMNGVAPDDAETLIVEPLERALAGLDNLKEITAEAAEGIASVTLEFTPGSDSDQAMSDVRDAVERAKPNLPEDATDPIVSEFDVSLFPIITVMLSGPVPERKVMDIAQGLRDEIESIDGVLEVDIGGTRDEIVEVLIDPAVFETYNLSLSEVMSQFQRNNMVVAAGAIQAGTGRVVLKVPGLIEDLPDILDLPVRADNGTVVRLGDVATVRRTFEYPDSFARLNGAPAFALEVKKRSGANIIDTVAELRDRVDATRATWPETLQVTYLNDQSEAIETLLSDLEANVLTAVLLVMIVILIALGPRASVLVGIAIPGAFLTGVAIVWAQGYTLNIVVLFSLILVVGMLVDGAIVVVEYADREMQSGQDARSAYRQAAIRMAWPIIASTATTISVFLPLMFWGGIMGEFMKYLPITVIATLSVSVVMALIFIPVVGSFIGARRPLSGREKAVFKASETGDPRELGGFTGYYARVLNWVILRPLFVVATCAGMLVASFALYGAFGSGLTFFPSVEPEVMKVELRARDSFSIYERDEIVREAEAQLTGMDEIENAYVLTSFQQLQAAEVIGTFQLDLAEWDTRRTAAVIGDDIRDRLAGLPGVEVQVETEAAGPSSGKPISVEVTGSSAEAIDSTVDLVLAEMDRLGGFRDITTTQPFPGVEWMVRVDRAEAARFGADVSLVGQAILLLTQGVQAGSYNPADAEEAVDITVRFPPEDRSLQNLAGLHVTTSSGLVPISNFVTFEPVDRSGKISRVDRQRTVTIEADVDPGLLPNDQFLALSSAMNDATLPEGTAISYGGEAEDQAEASSFLLTAFAVAVGLMFAILLVQFNSVRQTFLVLTAIVFSVAGVLIALMIAGEPFNIVMSGVGVIALAGIVVNNNIVLIDAFNEHLAAGRSALEAALRTGVQRLRPVVLTSVTTIVGLMPMVLGANVDVVNRHIAIGAPSTQYWTELSTTIAGGLVFATFLTLLVTPAMLVLVGRKRN